MTKNPSQGGVSPILLSEMSSKENNGLSPLLKGNKLVVIEGAIGAGKTSLSRMLADRWSAHCFFENFEENPFLLNGFYENREAYAFSTEMFFLLTRYRQQRELQDKRGIIISDYFFEKCALFAKQNLSVEDYEIFSKAYDSFMPNVRTPDLIIFLQADLETLLRHVYFRDRQFERKLSPAYLERLMLEYQRFFLTYSRAPVLTIPTSSLDFVNDSSDFRKVCHLIEERLSGKIQLSLRTRGREKTANA